MKSSETPAARRTVRKKLADGSIKVYSYDRPPQPRVKRQPMPADSIHALIEAYERSAEWLALAPRTRKNRLNSFRHLNRFLQFRLGEWKRREILLVRDGIAMARGPAAANAFISAVGTLFSWARDRGWIDFSPIDRIKSLGGGTFPTWTEAELATALRCFPEHLRRALLLAVHTGQRRGDLCRLRWQDVAGGVLKLVQEKTGVSVVVRLHPELSAELARWRKDSQTPTILQNAEGQAWDREALTMEILRARRRAGMRDKLNLHGLRKLAATRLAEAGCTPHEIAAITGHTTLKEVVRYTAAADRERLAASAMDRLQTAQMTTARNRLKG